MRPTFDDGEPIGPLTMPVARAYWFTPLELVLLVLCGVGIGVLLVVVVLALRLT